MMITAPLWSERTEDILNAVFPTRQLQRALIDEIKRDQRSYYSDNRADGYGNLLGHHVVINPDMFRSDRGITPGETKAIIRQWVAHHADIEPSEVTIRFYRTSRFLLKPPFIRLEIDRMHIGYDS